MRDYENENMMQNVSDGNEEENAVTAAQGENTTDVGTADVPQTADTGFQNEADTQDSPADSSFSGPHADDNNENTAENAVTSAVSVRGETPVQPYGGYGSDARIAYPAVSVDPEPAGMHATYTPQPQPQSVPQYQQARPQTAGDARTWSPYPSGAKTANNGYTVNNGYTANSGYNAAGGAPAGYRSNPYQGRAYNAYAPQSSAAGGATGEISYAPAKKKEKKSVGVKAVAAICAVCVLLSGLCGFGGTLLANRLTGNSEKTVVSEQHTAAAQSSAGDSVVIYKSVEDVATSTAASSGSDLTYAQVASVVKDSVVEINTEYTTRNSWFQYTTGGAGSGVVISDDGYVITNAHVVLDENMQNVADTVTVRLTNGEEYPAQVKVYDSDEDIAILKIDATGLTPARCGDSDKLVVGEELIIVGNPLGELGGSVSNGIVSATEREIQVGGVSMHLIQTNAAVNPGNSGGGMFNMKGELVGIVNAKSSGTGIEGLGFAIPINQALTVSEQLLTYGYVRGKPMIGVSFSDVSGSNYFFYYNVKAGVYVSSLVKGMNDKVLKEGDRIIAVNGEEISSSEDIKAIVYASSIGDKLTFQLYRDNKLMEVEVTCYERTPDVSDSSISFGTEEVPGSLNDFFGGR